MKRFFAICTLIALLLTGCTAAPQSDRLQIVCTVFPQYDWLRNILGEHASEVELTLLMDGGADLHNYQASAEDILKITACDLFVYVGGVSDDWAVDALEQPHNANRKALSLLEMAETRTEEAPLGAEAENDEEPDEHVWLSLRQADTCVNALTDALVALDPANEADYRQNAADYRASLAALDQRYNWAVNDSVRTTLLFADRFPFRYMADDYGLTCYAAFSGCSAETEASFSVISSLTETLNTQDLPFIMVTETADQSIANALIRNSNGKDQEILVLDSLQTVTRARVDAGETYLTIMEQNLSVLTRALQETKEG